MAIVLHPWRGASRPRVAAPSLMPALAGLAALVLVAVPRMSGPLGARATAVAVAFVSLVVESLPFLLVGAALAALLGGRAGMRLLEMAKDRPRLAGALAPLSGVALPLCDCGIVPIARRLRDGGMSRAAVNGFVAGAPLTNPIVVVSTLVAFPGSPGMVLGRIVVGLGVAALAAALAPPPRAAPVPEPCSDEGRPGFLNTVAAEMNGMGPTLVLGALAAATLKAFLPTTTATSWADQPLLGAVAMMALAFVMSICSQADAFVAASLPVGALPRLAFLVLGPLFDLRLAGLYRRQFGTGWVVGYGAVVVPAVLVLATAWTTWSPW